MSQADFLSVEVLFGAAYAAPRVGLWNSVVLAQWADETGWGTSDYWTVGHNPAGISPGGVVASYPTVQAGIDAYVETMNLPYYDEVRAAKNQGNIAQAAALGASPWAGGHYGNPPGADLENIIRENDLGRFDQIPVSVVPPATPPARPHAPEWSGEISVAYLAAVGRRPSQSEIDYWRSMGTGRDPWGLDHVLEFIANSPEAKAYRVKVNRAIARA